MADHKKQHFVPKAYLRLFSDDDKNIGTFIKSKHCSTDNPAAIKNQSYKNNFYDDKELENSLGLLEEYTIRIIYRILNESHYALSQEDYEILYTFIIIQRLRTLDSANSINAFMNLYNEHNTSLGNHNLIITNAVLASLYHGIKHLDICLDLKYKFLKICKNNKMRFITSDNPVCFYDSFFERYGYQSIGLGSKGLQIYMPLSEQMAIVLYDGSVYKYGKQKEKIIILDKQSDVDAFNDIVILNSNEVLYYKQSCFSKTQIDNYINNHIQMLDKRDIKYDNSNNKASVIRSVYPMIKADFSFVKLLDKVKIFDNIPYRQKLNNFLYR